ncbi:MAG TPA: sigma-70 family RNA polymerase sigma factor [Usitatibacter sp.]|nr:sigma-70 family RNA polymerase sigma factor [Usitatibacter sp.]
MLAYAGGDPAAFESLYGRHKGALFRFVARSVKARAEAEELFQEIWMRVIESRARYRPQAKFGTWLYTIAHHRLIDHWRAKGLAVVSLDDEDCAVPEAAAAPDAEPHRAAEARETLGRLAGAFEALPLAQREALLLHLEGGLTVPEIAEATGANEEAAKSRLRYAMGRLREAIADE